MHIQDLAKHLLVHLITVHEHGLVDANTMAQCMDVVKSGASDAVGALRQERHGRGKGKGKGKGKRGDAIGNEHTNGGGDGSHRRKRARSQDGATPAASSSAEPVGRHATNGHRSRRRRTNW